MPVSHGDTHSWGYLDDGRGVPSRGPVPFREKWDKINGHPKYAIIVWLRNIAHGWSDTLMMGIILNILKHKKIYPQEGSQDWIMGREGGRGGVVQPL